VIEDNVEHLEKQRFPKDVIEFGIVIDDSVEHLEKQLPPSDVIELGIKIKRKPSGIIFFS
jgi:hypothetical protein